MPAARESIASGHVRVVSIRALNREPGIGTNRVTMLRNTLLLACTFGSLGLFPAVAYAGPCALDPDCPGDQVCVDLICADSADELDACDDQADCHVGSCVDGFCKRDSIQCESEAGDHCSVGQNSFDCLCHTGEGFGGAGGSPGDGEPQPEPDPDEMYSECLDWLLECDNLGGDGDGDGDEGGDEPPEPGDEEGQDPEDGASDGGTGEADQGDEALGDDFEGRGCSVGGSGASGLLALLLGLVVGRRRRR